jgi:hypothetical protein
MQYTGQHKSELNSILARAAHFKPRGAFIAGGALTSAFTGQPINDVDYYFKTKEAFMEAVELAYDDCLWCVSATDRAVTFVSGGDVIQLMHFDFFETAEDIFDAFDYTVCMAAYDIDKADFVMHEDFLKHASQRFLRFHSGTRYPYGSLMRVLKYQQRGYTIGKSDLLRIGLSLQKVKIESWDDLAAAIGGQYGEKAKVDTETPFSLEAAIDLFKDTEITVKDKEDMPGNVEDLMVKIGLGNGYLEYINDTE